MRTILRLPVRYCVTLAVLVAPIAATLLARRALGPDPTPDDIRRLGFGLPALEEGRWWTLFTGMVLVESLAIPLPSFTAVAVALHEHVAGHWRALAALVGGQLLGVLVVLVAIVPLRDDTGDFAREVTTAADFGISVGGFACLGAWTAYLGGPMRRAVRWGVSCYLLGPLLLSGLIYDLSHPAGWLLGLLAGPALMRPRLPNRTPFRRRELPWIVLAVVIGIAIGIYAARDGGVGGIFGWGRTWAMRLHPEEWAH